VEPLSPFEQFVETVVLTQLKQDIHILDVFEKVHKLGYIIVLDRSVDLDFTHQLLLGSRPRE